MRNLIELYNIALELLKEYKAGKEITHNGLCILPEILHRDYAFISGEEYISLEKDLASRLRELSNLNTYPCYKWIPMQCKDGQIQERIDFIQSIINELENR